ncbi:MAG: hypothetical protein UV46_C0003G0001, partial [Candidatus Gottesmanbacteria bacterium GW2011_GWC2_42_8]
DIPASTIPESFKVLVKELQALGLNVIPTGTVTYAKKTTGIQGGDENQEQVEKQAEELAKASGVEIASEEEKGMTVVNEGNGKVSKEENA